MCDRHPSRPTSSLPHVNITCPGLCSKIPGQQSRSAYISLYSSLGIIMVEPYFHRNFLRGSCRNFRSSRPLSGGYIHGYTSALTLAYSANFYFGRIFSTCIPLSHQDDCGYTTNRRGNRLLSHADFCVNKKLHVIIVLDLNRFTPWRYFQRCIQKCVRILLR